MDERMPELTPLMKQYSALKKEAESALLLFRMGDFYELFGDDAITASRVLEITLTSRDKNKPNPLPMAGVPAHSLQGYLDKLLCAGFKVAIAEQMEDPELAKGIVERQITRVFTPAVRFSAEGSEASLLCAVLECPKGGFAIGCIDPATGDTIAGGPFSLEELAQHMRGLSIRHLISLGEIPISLKNTVPEKTLIEPLDQSLFSQQTLLQAARKSFGLACLTPLVGSDDAEVALGLAITYTLRSQRKDSLPHLKRPEPLSRQHGLTLGPRAAKHLDLFPTIEGDPTLFNLLNQTKTSPGARMLRRWVSIPLGDPREILERRSAIQELSALRPSLTALRVGLGKIYDLERVLARVSTQLSSPKDMLALGHSLQAIPEVLACAQSFISGTLKKTKSELSQAFTSLEKLSQRLASTLREDAPISHKDGGIFKLGTDPDLDRLITLSENGEKSILALEARERAQTGISSIKIRYSRVFGYTFEVTKSNLEAVPPHFHRKQSIAGGERFVTLELSQLEEELSAADLKRRKFEHSLFEHLISDTTSLSEPILQVSRSVSELDCMASLAMLAHEPGWIFPEIDDSLDLHIELGRHPVVDQAVRGAFVPNTVSLSPSTRLTLLITGPNMGGKSTLLRQTAILVLLGQMGAPIPARSARWGYFTSIHTRLGAHDAIAKGQSTFMVEMTELAHILHRADSRSLVILDEIGRGTSTYDGMSVAWATLEWIASHSKSRALFATHYHELTHLEGSLIGMANAHLAVETRGEKPDGTLRFLHELREGPSSESFGIQVARLAGLPLPVVERAWAVLSQLESIPKDRAPDPAQLELFVRTPKPRPEPAPLHPLISELKTTDVNAMTPLQALNFLAKLKEGTLKEGEQGPEATSA